MEQLLEFAGRVAEMEEARGKEIQLEPLFDEQGAEVIDFEQCVGWELLVSCLTNTLANE